MPEFKVTVTSGYKKIYYVQADNWEQAEEIASTTDQTPDFEKWDREQIEAEEMKTEEEDNA